MLQSQQHNIRFGMGAQNDVLADNVLAQGWQAGLFGQLQNSIGPQLCLCRFWRKESRWPTTGRRPRQHRDHLPEVSFQLGEPSIGCVYILKLEERENGVQVRQEIRCGFDLGVQR